MNHQAKVLTEAIGLKKVRSNGGGITITHEMHLMECSSSWIQMKKRNLWTVLTRMGATVACI